MRLSLLVTIAILLALAAPAGARASDCGTGGSGAERLALDGQFADWVGQPCVPDPPGDCGQPTRDISGVWFGTNPDDPTAYFMVERQEGDGPPVGILISVDTGDDGDYTAPGDRVVAVSYHPGQADSRVDVELWDGTGALLGQLAANADLGESRDEGGRRVEVGVPFAQLGITAGQAIRFTATSQTGNIGGQPCDSAPEVQWSPANALGLLLIVVAAGGAWALARRRRLERA